MQDILLYGAVLPMVQRIFCFLKNTILMNRKLSTTSSTTVKKVKNIILSLMQKVSDIPKLWQNVSRLQQELKQERLS